MRRFFCSILVWLTALWQAQPARAALAEIPFEFSAGLLWVQVQILPSDKPLNFIVDTGAGVSVVHAATAKQLGLPLGRRVTVRGVRTKLTGRWPTRVSAQASGARLVSDFLILDLSRLARSCARSIDGLLGADFFRDRIVQIDFETGHIRLCEHYATTQTDLVLPLQVRPSGMHVPIRVNQSRPQWVRLDTGCASALQWVTADVWASAQCKQTAVGLTDLAIPQTETTLFLDQEQFHRVPTGLHRKAIFPGEAGLLGTGLLARFHTVTIDAKSGQLFLGRSAADN